MPAYRVTAVIIKPHFVSWQGNCKSCPLGYRIWHSAFLHFISTKCRLYTETGYYCVCFVWRSSPQDAYSPTQRFSVIDYTTKLYHVSAIKVRATTDYTEWFHSRVTRLVFRSSLLGSWTDGLKTDSGTFGAVSSGLYLHFGAAGVFHPSSVDVMQSREKTTELVNRIFNTGPEKLIETNGRFSWLMDIPK